MDSAGKFRMNEGDWICSDSQCANLNFARRSACNRCNKEKENQLKKKLGQEIGKTAAEKSKGLFSADDWQCSKCCNVNWARRTQCNVCNAPKVEEVEERTGYGGGYNDRGVVEYVKRDDSDDEYDEFGRRKKRKTKSGNQSSPRSNSNRRNDNDDNDTYEEEEKRRVHDDEDDDEDDDDDDDDDDDLSKYDLSEWDDLTAKSQKDKEKDNMDTEIRPDKDRQDNIDKYKGTRRYRSRSRSRSRSPL